MAYEVFWKIIYLIWYFSEQQTNVEDAKVQEVSKLQKTIHALQSQVEEANAMVVKEKEAARKAIEEAPPVIKETPVIVQDTEKVNELTAELEQLKVIYRWTFWCLSHWVILSKLM